MGPWTWSSSKLWSSQLQTELIRGVSFGACSRSDSRFLDESSRAPRFAQDRIRPWGSDLYEMVDHHGAESPRQQLLSLTAIEEQLGLKLVQTKSDVRVLVVDNIDMPTPD